MCMVSHDSEMQVFLRTRALPIVQDCLVPGVHYAKFSRAISYNSEMAIFYNRWAVVDAVVLRSTHCKIFVCKCF